MINLNISTRLWIGFGVMMLITLLVSGLSYVGISDLRTQLPQSAAESASVYLTLILIGAVFSVVSAVVCAMLTARTIIKPLNNAVSVAKAVAAGNLSNRIDATGNDEFSQLLHALDDMSQSLNRFVTSVRGSSDSISVASRELSMGNADLSQRTEQQASSIEQTAANMEELNSTVRRNADSAKEAERLSVLSSEVAMRGGGLSTQLVHSMQGITESSQKASEIITVIDGIAFQTNILALNAAVEAARAGEHGRGFAVVATEVRTLAQRSATASKEIKELIVESINRAEEGSALVAQTGHTMEEIVIAAKQVVDIMREISSASQEQSNGISEVNSAINQIEQVTQQNAALVEQAAAAAESMEEQARTLMKAVESIRINNGGGSEAISMPTKNVTPAKPMVKASKTFKSSAKPLAPKPMLSKSSHVKSAVTKASMAKPAFAAKPASAPKHVPSTVATSAPSPEIKSPVVNDEHRFEPSVSEDEWERF